MKRNWKKVLKSRKTAWVLLVCLMAGAISGTVYKNSRSGRDIEGETVSDPVAVSDPEQLQALGEENNSEKGPEENAEDQLQADAGKQSVEQESGTDKTAGIAENKAASGDEGKVEDAAPVASIIKAENLDFLTESRLSWPVEGEVLLEFNMDETIYFPTLNLYKCSQGMVIQSEEGTPVCAPAQGVVVSIGMDEQIGNYMVLDVGDGYQVKMGQLKDMKVSEGAQVKEGDLLAYIAAPAKCYSVEGDNLYLEVTENGIPVDPLDYLKY